MMSRLLIIVIHSFSLPLAVTYSELCHINQRGRICENTMEICETAHRFQLTDCTEQVTESLSKLQNPKQNSKNFNYLSLSLFRSVT